jgi:hypothetical protein
MTKSSMFAPSNSIRPVHGIIKRRDPGRHIERTARGAWMLRPPLSARRKVQGHARSYRRPGRVPRRSLAPGADDRWSSSSNRRALWRRAMRRPPDADRALRLLRRVRPSDARAFIPSRPSHPSPSRMPVTISAEERSASGVFDAEDERAAMPARVEPIEERGARAPDMEIAGRRWCKTDAGTLRHGRV